MADHAKKSHTHTYTYKLGHGKCMIQVEARHSGPNMLQARW